MKKITFFLLILNSFFSSAQIELTTTKGVIQFDASIPLFEEIKAINQDVKCTLDVTTNELNCTVTILDFKFKKELMRTHFNKYYCESDRYPKAVFMGRIEKFDYKLLTTDKILYQLKGIIKIHGKSKPLFCTVEIRKINNNVELNTNFVLNTEDFNIEIPAIVDLKISKQVATTVHAMLYE